MKFLAIESSCDDTGAAVFDGPVLLAQVAASQAVHKAWGGVVPELASRAHQQVIVQVVAQALEQAGCSPQELEAIAYTSGPGLLGSLLVGQSFAKGMSLALNVPIVGVHHMHAHVLAHMIEEPRPEFPFICLTVSGGHTQLVWVEGPLQMRILGQTQDDAAGEAFDKTAKMLGLPYPGGPEMDRIAAVGNPKAYAFPSANMPGLDFSFSGLKTAVLYFVQKMSPEQVQANLADICASVQHTIVRTLLTKLELAAAQMSCDRVAIAGGVSANSGLRLALKELAVQRGWQVFIPDFAYCTDNAAMIGMAAYYKLEAGLVGSLDDAAEPGARF